MDDSPKNLWKTFLLLKEHSAPSECLRCRDGLIHPMDLILINKYRTSGYLIDTPCHDLDDGPTRTILVATEQQKDYVHSHAAKAETSATNIRYTF